MHEDLADTALQSGELGFVVSFQLAVAPDLLHGPWIGVKIVQDAHSVKAADAGDGFCGCPQHCSRVFSELPGQEAVLFGEAEGKTVFFAQAVGVQEEESPVGAVESARVAVGVVRLAAHGKQCLILGI